MPRAMASLAEWKLTGSPSIEIEPLLGRSDAVAQARVLEALHRSAETAQPVTL